MKGLLTVLLAVFLINSFFASDIYVDPSSGSDNNPGTKEKPFATITKARDSIREQKLNQDMKANITVWLHGGRYALDETLIFDYRDSGSNGYKISYRAIKGEKPILCGGKKITGWVPVPGKPYFEANVPLCTPMVVKSEFNTGQIFEKDGFAEYFAQLYVNGVRAERAKSHSTITSSRDKWWDDPETYWFRDGIYVSSSDIKQYSNVEDIQILWVEEFKCSYVPLRAILPSGKDEMILKMKTPDFTKVSGWKYIKPSSHFFVINAIEELDEPGEWYLDSKKRIVYYYPFKRDGDLSKIEIWAPKTGPLLKIDGAPMSPVNDISLEGITFRYGNWEEAKNELLGFSQAEIFKDYTSEISGQLILDYANNITISDCTVKHMGSCGIQVYEGCNNILIDGNLTFDTTAAGISIGKWWSNKRDCPKESICTDITVSNNLVRCTGRDYLQGTGINIFTTNRCKIYHNDISDTAYTALHARIGDDEWIHPFIGRLEYKWNKVSHAFQGHKWGIADGGHIYMHGRYPASEVSENYSLYANSNINCEYYGDNFSHTVRWLRNVSYKTKSETPYKAWHPGNIDIVFEGNYSDKENKKVGRAKQINFGSCKLNRVFSDNL